METTFGLSDIALWMVFLGFIAPIVIAFVSRPTLKPWVKIVIQVVFCVIVGTITAYLNGQFEGRSIVSIILLVFAISVLAYKGFWKPTGISDRVEAGVLTGPDADAAVVEPDETNPQDVVADDGSVYFGEPDKGDVK